MALASEERVLSLDPLFGKMGIEAGRDIWESLELSAREKAILLIAADVRVPELGLPFELHVEMAVTKVKMAPDHVREILRHVAPDAGFNITAMAFQRLVEILRTLGIADDGNESESHEQDGETGTPYTGEGLGFLEARDPKFAALVRDRSRRLWSRPQLSWRERVFATLAVDVIGGTLGAPFDVHLAVAETVGISRIELFAMLRLLAEFSIPKAWEAHAAIAARDTAQSRNTHGD